MKKLSKRKKTYYPKIGLRIIKTVIAVFICFVIDYYRKEVPFYSIIAAVLCMQPDTENSIRISINRTFGTFVGGFYAFLMLFLIQITSLSVHTIPHYIILSLFIIPLIYTTILLKKTSAAYITCVVFFSITVSHVTDGNPYLFGINRILDTLIGIFVSLAINKLIFPRKQSMNLRQYKSVKLKHNMIRKYRRIYEEQ